MSDSVVMTVESHEALKREIERLETEGRREIADRIKTAREFGDLKENAEYHAARNSQGWLETKSLTPATSCSAPRFRRRPRRPTSSRSARP